MIQRIKACLNGRRSPADHPAVPVTPAELAAAAAGAEAAGAEAVHLHARGPDGAESVLAADVAAAVAAIRRACPALPVGVSTGLWITGGDVAARAAMVREWAGIPAAERPDFASINVAEPGFAELAGLLWSAGVGAEAGVWSPADVDRLAAASHTDRWLRVVVEVMDTPAAEVVAAADTILRRLDAAGVTAAPLVHGEEAGCWPLVAHAGRIGLATRIGLEDVTTGPTGEPVAGNAELVRLAVTMWETARG